MKFKHYLSIFAIAVVVASCSKGDTGATGPQGPAGTSGLTATYYTVTTSGWTYNGSSQWYVNTGQDVPNGDGVMVYVSTGSGIYTPLPAITTFFTDDYLTYVYGGSSTGLTIWYSYPTSPTTAPSTSATFEVVDIPPAINVKYPNVNWNNYAEVSALPEFQAALKVK